MLMRLGHNSKGIHKPRREYDFFYFRICIRMNFTNYRHHPHIDQFPNLTLASRAWLTTRVAALPFFVDLKFHR